MTEPTRRCWPEQTIPTAGQLARWLTICTDEEREEFAERALYVSQAWSAVWMRGLDATPDILASRVLMDVVRAYYEAVEAGQADAHSFSHLLAKATIVALAAAAGRCRGCNADLDQSFEQFTVLVGDRAESPYCATCYADRAVAAAAVPAT